jgi:uncharacterized membrane protein YhaH (DUF805 family)
LEILAIEFKFSGSNHQCHAYTTIVGTVSLGLEGGQILQGVVNLILLLPSFAVSCRRMHDIGKSGWSVLWMLTIIGIPVVIYWWAKDTDHELVDSES